MRSNPILEKFDKIQIIYPECHNSVTEGFDFINEKHPEPRVKAFAHNLYEDKVYDGILVSKAFVASKPLFDKIKEMGGIRAHRRITDPNMFTMGDCGAYSFVEEYEPKFTCEEVYDYYEDLGFDFGIGLDHIITGFSNNNNRGSDEQIRRQNLTIENNLKMLKMVKERKANFYLMGSAQGWNPESYRISIERLAEGGFKYIAIGGVAGLDNKKIMALLDHCRSTIKKWNVAIHILGVTRTSLIPTYQRTNVVTCDSTTNLIQAVTNPEAAYKTGIGNQSMRCMLIPSVKSTSGRGKELIQKMCEGDESRFEEVREELWEMEMAAMNALRDYDKRKIGLHECAKIVENYVGKFEGHSHESFMKYVKTTLHDRPWETCGCKMCKEIGVEITLLRGADRNFRRAFHNIHGYYKQFQKALKLKPNLRKFLKKKKK